jgi:MFS family permease
LMTAFTPRVPPPTYSQQALESELASAGSLRTHENPTTQNIPVPLPPDTNTGWLGVAWLLIATIPAAIGGGMLQPTINSLITKRISVAEIGGMLGISAALMSAANAIAPVLWGAIFQAFGSSWPFILGGVLLFVLLLLSLRWLTPGREERQQAGLAHSNAAD